MLQSHALSRDRNHANATGGTNLTSKKKIASVIILVVILGTVGFSLLGGFIPEGEITPIENDIVPNYFNSLNWWDLPWELTSIGEFLNPLIAMDDLPNRHHTANPAGYLEASEYLIDLLSGWGLDTEYEGSHQSVIALQEGYSDANRAIVFGTPLDTAPTSSTVNQNSAGVAVLTQIAHILSRFRLPIDIYYCYYSYSLFTESDFRVLYGSQEIADYFNSQGTDIIASFHFENLLYYNTLQDPQSALLVEYDPSETTYQTGEFLADLLDSFMMQHGYDIVSTRSSSSYRGDYLSFLESGFPAINIHSGHTPDPEFPPVDSVYSRDYNREHAVALAETLSSIAIFLANSGDGTPVDQTLTVSIGPSETASIYTVMSVSQQLEIVGVKNETHDLELSIVSSDSVLLQGVVSGVDFSITAGTATGLGPVHITARNLGETSMNVTLTTQYEMDVNGNGVTDSVEYSWDDPIPALDWDRDALSDIDEVTAGTDIFVADTDSDTMNDGFEVAYGLDPLRNDALDDLDSDGLTNIREHTLGTFPNSTDTDKDQMDDFWEITFRTNPLVNDSSLDPDNDTLTNLEEYQFGADPFSKDGDYDGVLDSEEIALGMNPLSSDSDNDGLRDQLELIEGLDPLVPDYDVDIQPDGPDHNPRVNSLVVIIGLALIPVILGSILFYRRLR